MLKLWMVVVVLAAPILCEINKGSEEKIFVKNVNNYINEECLSKFDPQRKEYAECMGMGDDQNDQKNRDEFYEDFQEYFSNSTLNSTPGTSGGNRTELVAVFQKHCPNMDKCSEIITPMHNACFPAVYTYFMKLGREISAKVHELFCKNDFESVTKLVDAKIYECGMSKKEELMQCLEEYKVELLNSEITTHLMCNLVGNAEKCVVPKLEQCTLSQTAGAVLKSFLIDIRKGTVCENFSANAWIKADQ